MPNTNFFIDELTDFFEYGQKKKLNFQLPGAEEGGLVKLTNVTVMDFGVTFLLKECYVDKTIDP